MISERARFIPACAGNSLEQATEDISTTVHPRVCGEQGRLLVRYPARRGSSPRVRGTVQLRRQPIDPWRFIPAVCGEQGSGGYYQFRMAGSSPRVRGTVLPDSGGRPTRRFIPACAGNSRVQREKPPAITVHPRVCGEQMIYPIKIVRICGSSPRVRGTVATGVNPNRPARFIPACAGNRRRRYAVVLDSGGSSPRVRGTVDVP